MCYKSPSIVPQFPPAARLWTCWRPLLAVAWLCGLTVAAPWAQAPSDDDALPEGGIPVTSDVVRRACGRCHRSDAQGQMTRISYQRTTPEGWQQTVRRMVLLNGLEISPKDAREAVRYLATHHGLAPEEARPGAFEVERRLIDYHHDADPETQVTCNRCHSMGRVLNQRRTAEEWELLTAMHRGYYPLTDFQSFQRGGPPQPGADGELDRRTAVDKAVAYLSSAFPLDTPEWTNWSANMRDPRLEGRWAIVGHERGHGPVYGEMVVTATPGAADAFETRARYTHPMRDVSATRTGQAVVYTGFQWRGRSGGANEIDLREVMSVSRDRQEMTGRWFTGAYDERGVDVTLRRVGAEPLVTGVYPRAVPSAAGEVTLQLYGANFPATLAAGAIDLGSGLTIASVSDVSSTRASLRVTVAPDASIGPRDLFVGQAALTDAVVVFDTVHQLRVTPATGLARVGGVAFPKQYARFEARAYHHGPDGATNTDDDLNLGTVDVDWSLEEYAATFGDDDLSFVGAIGGHGVFEPAGRRAESGPGRQEQRRRRVGRRHAAERPGWGSARDAAHGARTPARVGAALHSSRRERAVTEIALGECHAFEAAGRRFLYLVPSAAVFALDEISAAVVDDLRGGHRTSSDLATRLSERFDAREVESTLSELAGARAITRVDSNPTPPTNIIPLTPIPLSTVVVNVTNQCNLSCAYCYGVR